jgi:dolichol-phosphate mannosyltransferase
MWLTRVAGRSIRRLAEVDLPDEAGDFKLLSRRVVDHLLALGEHDLYMRGLVSWLGFRQVAVPYERQARASGRTHFPLFGSLGPVSTFASGVTSFSHVPLVFFLVLGLLGGALSGLTLLGLALARLFGGQPGATAGLIAFGTLLWSTLAAGIGVLGLYLARIHREVLGRPRYVVESTIGFDPPS